MGWGYKKLSPCHESIHIPSDASFFFRHLTLNKLEIPFHFHQEYEIAYIIQGKGTRYIGDSIQPFDRGDLVLLGPHLGHTWTLSKECKRIELITIQFDLNFLGTDFMQTPEASAWRRFLPHANHGVAPLGKTAAKIQQILLRMKKEVGFSRLISLFQVMDLFSTSKEIKTISLEAASHKSIPSSDSRMGKVIRYLEENYSQKITLEAIAKIAMMSRVSFSRYCKYKTGIPFNRLLRSIRIGKSCEFLQNTNRSISEIALATGYESLATFNRQFLSEKQISPSHLRKLYQNLDTTAEGDYKST